MDLKSQLDKVWLQMLTKNQDTSIVVQNKKEKYQITIIEEREAFSLKPILSKQ